MEVFVIPVGNNRYELYCEQPVDADADADPAGAPSGIIGRLRYRFSSMLRAAEERQHRDPAAEREHAGGWPSRVQERMMGWVAERIAEQRLLWNLRRQTSVVAVYPSDMTLDESLQIIRTSLQRDYERHRLWLVVDTLGLIASGAVAIVPGPNVLAYYFIFRVVGHWLSMRGASQGIHHVQWSGRSCPPLSELRELAHVEPTVRVERVHEVAARLRLEKLATFFERVAIPQA